MLKLDPRTLAANPVIFITEVIAAVVTVLLIRDLVAGTADGFTLQIAVWLWLTVLFANFSEAVAEGRGRAQADALRSLRTSVMAARLTGSAIDGTIQMVPALDLDVGDRVIVRAGEIIPSDGEIIEGIASVNEAAVTGESAP